MLSYLNTLSIKNKILTVAIVPSVVIMLLSIYLFFIDFSKTSQLEKMENLVLLDTKISFFLHETQKERGLTASYLGNKDKSMSEKVNDQRKLTDDKLKDLKDFYATLSSHDEFSFISSKLNNTFEERLNKLNSIRNTIDMFDISTNDAIAFYTDINSNLLDIVLFTTQAAKDDKIKNNLQAYYNFLMSKERAGIERAIGANTFANKTFKPGLFKRYIEVVNQQNAFFRLFTLNGSNYLNFVNSKLDDPSVKEVERMRNILLSFEENKDKEFDIDPNYWFSTVTKKINLLKEIDDHISMELLKNIEDILHEQKVETIILIISVLLSLVFVIFFATLYIRSINRAINKLVVGIEKFGLYVEKEINEIEHIDLKTKGELGKLATVVNRIIDNINGEHEKDSLCVGESIITLNLVENGIYSARVKSIPANPQVNTLSLTINAMLDKQQNVINSILKTLKEYTNYNYTNSIKLSGVEGESKQLIDGINALGEAIRKMLNENKNNGVSLQEGSTQLLTNVDMLNRASNEAAASLEETAAAIEEISGNINSSATNVIQMANNARALSLSANTGKDLANQTVKSMDDINTQVSAINEAITVIDQISFQTNILSLNAAVEAATAGEAGKGFAVVAAEVRNLASRSAEAAKEIKHLVEQATSKSNEGKNIASEMIEGYNKLNENINDTLSLISEVEHSSKEQRAGIIQISDAINSLDKQTQINANIASQTNDIANLSYERANEMLETVNKVKF